MGPAFESKEPSQWTGVLCSTLNDMVSPVFDINFSLSFRTSEACFFASTEAEFLIGCSIRFPV